MPYAQLSQWAQDSAPCAAQVELGCEGEKAVGGGVDMCGESGDGGGERVVVHGGEIVRENRMGSRHWTIKFVRYESYSNHIFFCSTSTMELHAYITLISMSLNATARQG